MGYTTDFWGRVELDHPLTDEHAAYLRAFNQTRRMARREDLAVLYSDPIREAVGLPVGPEGGYFVGGEGFMGQDGDNSVTSYNDPPAGQPGLWCQWVPSEDGSAIEWDQGEKFYDYVAWMKYLINHFLKPWGYVANGEIQFQGEDEDDRGILVVKDNRVGVSWATRVYGEVKFD